MNSDVYGIVISGKVEVFQMGIVDTLTFTEDNMNILLEAYDAYYELVDALKLVNGGGGDLGIKQ